MIPYQAQNVQAEANPDSGIGAKLVRPAASCWFAHSRWEALTAVSYWGLSAAPTNFGVGRHSIVRGVSARAGRLSPPMTRAVATTERVMTAKRRTLVKMPSFERGIVPRFVVAPARPMSPRCGQ